MNKKQKKNLFRIIIASILFIILKIVEIDNKIISLCLYAVPYLIVGYDILIKAFKGIKNREVFDENFLMAVATVGAVGLGEYEEGVAVMLFYQIGEWWNWNGRLWSRYWYIWRKRWSSRYGTNCSHDSLSNCI